MSARHAASLVMLTCALSTLTAAVFASPPLALAHPGSKGVGLMPLKAESGRLDDVDVAGKSITVTGTSTGRSHALHLRVGPQTTLLFGGRRGSLAELAELADGRRVEATYEPGGPGLPVAQWVEVPDVGPAPASLR